MKFTTETILAIAPAAHYAAELVKSQSVLATYGIDDASTAAHFLGQICTETLGLTRLDENLYYTSAVRLRDIWPNRFSSNSAAIAYVRNPKGLANLVYGGRMGNRPDTLDGWNYRGSGCIMTTGRTNFAHVHEANRNIPALEQPDCLRAFPAALEAACIFWRDNKLSRMVPDVAALTKAIQGGSGGLDTRRLYTARAVEALTNSIVPAPAVVYLKHGSTGASVKRLQERLTRLGYEVGAADGVYGDATQRGVYEFQRNKGIHPRDGIFGPMTAEVLAKDMKGLN